MSREIAEVRQCPIHLFVCVVAGAGLFSLIAQVGHAREVWLPRLADGQPRGPDTYEVVRARAERAREAFETARVRWAPAHERAEDARRALAEMEAEVQARIDAAAEKARESSIEDARARALGAWASTEETIRRVAAETLARSVVVGREARAERQTARAAENDAEWIGRAAAAAERWAAAWDRDIEWIEEALDVDPCLIPDWVRAERNMPDGNFYGPFSRQGRNWELVLSPDARRRVLEALVDPTAAGAAIAAEDDAVDARATVLDTDGCWNSGRRFERRVHDWLDAARAAAAPWRAAVTSERQHRERVVADTEGRARAAESDGESAADEAAFRMEVVGLLGVGTAAERARAVATAYAGYLGADSPEALEALEMAEHLEDAYRMDIARAEKAAKAAGDSAGLELAPRIRAAREAVQEAESEEVPFREARTKLREATEMLRIYDSRNAAWAAVVDASEEWEAAMSNATSAMLMGSVMRSGGAWAAIAGASRRITEASRAMIESTRRIPRFNAAALERAERALTTWSARIDDLRDAGMSVGGSVVATAFGLSGIGDIVRSGFNVGEAIGAADQAGQELLVALGETP